MSVFFPGDTETMTTSRYLLKSGNSQILPGCGLFQDYEWLCERSRQPSLPEYRRVVGYLLTGDASDGCSVMLHSSNNTNQQ